jgi:hypothetical protein
MPMGTVNFVKIKNNNYFTSCKLSEKTRIPDFLDNSENKSLNEEITEFISNPIIDETIIKKTIEKLIKLQTNRIIYDRMQGSYFEYMGYMKRPYSGDIDYLNKLLIDNFYEKYDKEIIMYETEEVNGYKLYNCENNLLSVNYFNQMKELWFNNEENKKYDEYEDFEKWFTDNTCSDWAKQDEHGNCFGGFWDYPEGTYEKENAWDLTLKANSRALYDLPYPRAVIVETVSIGCSNRMESVRYSNFICEWVKRKIMQQDE